MFALRSLDEARDVLRRYSDYFDTKTIKMYGAGNREVRQWIIQAARELELMPTTEGSLDLRLNLTMAQDGYSGTEHNLPGVPLFDDVVELVAQSNMATTPTVTAQSGARTSRVEPAAAPITNKAITPAAARNGSVLR